MKAKSLWYIGERQVELREVDIPEPGPYEVLVRVEACGVCTWDLFIYSGGFQSFKPYPFYFGHEGIGIVERTGPLVSAVNPGDRVALRESPVIGANARGHMAEYAIQREEVLIPLPGAVDRPETWMIEPVACCINGVDLAEIKPGARVALVGSGFMGSIILQLLAVSPASNVSVFDLRDESLEYARACRSHVPIEVYDLRDADTAPLCGSFDVVFETAAVESAFRLANSLVRAGGTLAIFSWQHHPFTFDFGDWHVRGIRVLNTSPAAAPDFTDCFSRGAACMERGIVDVAPLVTHVAKPEDAAALYEDGITKRNGYIKGVIRWN
jgi:threonine dehydrogenase-like Zn-dependent dehydrogenase